MKQIRFTMKKFLIYTAFACIGIATVSSCKKGIFDINGTNPNSPSSAPVEYLLPAALVNSARQIEGGNLDFAQFWMGYWALSASVGIDFNLVTYNVTNTFFTGNWSGNYLTLRNYNEIIKSASQNSELVYFESVARIMRAFHFANIVDLYNNVIYSEYGQTSDNLFPKYDDALVIYSDLLAQLDEAIADIDGATPTSAKNITSTQDVMFAGNMNSWRRFGQNLKLKLLMHLSNNSAYNDIVADGMASLPTSLSAYYTADATLNPGYFKGANESMNPKYFNLGFNITGAPVFNNGYYRACSYAVDFLNSKTDPRVTYFYKTLPGSGVKGRDFGSLGTIQEEGNEKVSGIGNGIIKDFNQPSVIMPGYQVHFLLAEAVQRGLITIDVTAQQLYEGGIRASCTLLTSVSGTPNADVIIFGYAAWDNATDKLDAIYRQAWIAANGFDPLEAYTTWRRTGYPTDLPISVYPGVSAETVPIRLQYPLVEFSANAANVEAQGSINPLTSKIFWMP